MGGAPVVTGQHDQIIHDPRFYQALYETGMPAHLGLSPQAEKPTPLSDQLTMLGEKVLALQMANTLYGKLGLHMPLGPTGYQPAVPPTKNNRHEMPP